MNYKLSYILLAIGFFVVSCGKPGTWGADKEKSSGGETIIETGTLEAINNQLFFLPRSMYWWEMRVIGILEHGATVNEGDSLIQGDPSEINRLILERETNLETQIANLEKMEVTNSNQISDMESKIRNETASFNLKKIEMESSLFETERRQAILQLEFKQADITLAKEKRKLELAKIIIANDMKIQNIRIRQIRDDIESFTRILPSFTIRTPVAGVFQRGKNMRTGVLLNTGDMAIPHYSVGNVPELKWMRVNTFINENDFRKLHVGQKVIVRLDALPDVKFNGEVFYIGKLCHLKEQKSRQKVFDVEVKMIDSDERLKPGMTVSCEYIINN
jgi:multidrug efflux pump subunit AcrA (membrane-fusion protein)